MKDYNIWSSSLFVMAFVVLFIGGCKKEDVNLAPGTVTLSAPVNAASEVAVDALLTWLATAGPDGDIVTYDVYLDTESNPAKVISDDQQGTSLAVTLTGNTTYYWKVVANDGNGNMSQSAIWSFTTINKGPGEVILTAPEDASSNVALEAGLSWQAATDPDGDPVTYDVYFGTDATPATIVSAGQTGSTFDPTLVGNTTYYWKVVANDG
ncbi:MAG: fibronectin type III domain-containing protein, partial [Cytophagales bacterium]|nr:fibronectin type III domain-containing protein [Cytophagales bacterium]